jgi:predicted enzyme related to lactoylglutathione lyase
MMNEHEKINYLEFPSRDMDATKAFFSKVFGWSYMDFGPDYVSVTNSGIECGFFKSELNARTEKGSVLVVFYSNALEQTLSKVEKAGGVIIKEIFSFPGGRRFHFGDSNGNEFAVWSDKSE